MKAFVLLGLVALVACCQAVELKGSEDVSFLETEPSQPAQPFTPFHPFGFGFGFGFPGYGFGFPGYGYGFPGYGFGGYNPYMMAGAYYMDPFLFNAFFTPNAMLANSQNVFNAAKPQ